MKTSELIAMLQAAIQKEGDLEVRVESDYDGQIEHLEPDAPLVLDEKSVRYLLIR